MGIRTVAQEISQPETSTINALTPGELVVDPPTLTCLGFRWETSGDANDNAAASIRYRAVGSREWKKGLNLWRLNGQPVVGYGKDEYIPEPMFAGSLFDLALGTEYEVEISITDPDGVNGEERKTVRVSTRKPAQAPADSRQLHLGGTRSDFRNFDEAVTALKPGDTLNIHAGTYALSKPGDADYLQNHAFTLDVQGTAERPITIRAAGDGEVIFDGQGGYMLFDVQNSAHLILEGLTIRGADFAVYLGGTLPCDNEGIVVKDCTFDQIAKPVQGFSYDPLTAKPNSSPRSSGEIRHAGGPGVKYKGVGVNPDDGGPVYGSLSDAVFGAFKPLKGCARVTKTNDRPIQPGDTVLVHNDESLLTHKAASHWGPCYFYNSTIVLNLVGTKEKPITIRGVGKPTFDGKGNYKIFDLQGSRHVILENLHFKNASFAIYKGSQQVVRPVEGLTIRHCRFEDVGCGVYGISGANRDVTITDNVFVGRCNREYPITEGKRGHRNWADDEKSYSAVHLAGQGNVISYNDIRYFFDGIQMQSNWATSPSVNTYWTAGGEEPAEYRTVSCDIVGNILQMTPDNAIEIDMSHHNIRIMRNLSTDVWGGYWSNQTLFGGPAYWIRNIAYAGWPATWKNDAGPVGVIAYHNTFLGGQPETWPPARAGISEPHRKSVRTSAL